MKVLAFADLHMGAGAAYADDRLLDQMKVLEQIATLVFERDIELVLIAGDVFHRPRPTPATLLAFRRFTDALATMEVPTIACLGNVSHDQEGIDRPCALDLFESRWFRVSRRPELITEFAGVAVATLPSVPVSRLVAQSESTERGPVFDQASEALLAVAAELKRDADASSRNPVVLMGHWSVSGASLPNGLPVDSLNEPVLDLASLERLNYDAIVMGHIHKPQPLVAVGANAGVAFYCGSPMNVDFGEPHEHGCWIIDTEAKTEFVPLKDRPFVTVDVDITLLDVFVAPGSELEWQSGTDPTSILIARSRRAIAETDGEGAVVRVRYRATEEQHRRIDTAAVKKSLLDAGAHKVFQISAEIVKQDRARVQGVDENLEPSAALALWCEANEISDTNGLADLLARYSVTAP